MKDVILWVVWGLLASSWIIAVAIVTDFRRRRMRRDQWYAAWKTYEESSEPRGNPGRSRW